MLSKNQNKLILFLIALFLIFSLANLAFAEEAVENLDEQLEELKNILASSTSYSAFQTSMLLKIAQDLLEAGVLFEDTKGIIENSVEKSFNAYSVKKVFDVILDTQQDGLPTAPLINKINEGLAKNVNKSEIFSVISAKAENLKKADEILNEARQEGLEIDGGEEIVKILADSLENDVPQESLSWLVKMGTKEGKSIEEITETSEELSYLSLLAYDSGLSQEDISLLFKKAMDSSSNIEEICENIQNNLEAEISTAKIEGLEEGKPSSTLDSGTISPSSEEGPVDTEIGETPTQEAGEAPTEETSAAPEESETTPEDETPPPPEN